MKTSIEVVVEVEIGRPRAEVWTYLSDAERLPDWLGEFTAARELSQGPTGVGTVVSYTVEGDRSGTYEIVEWDPPSRSAWDGPPAPVGRRRAPPHGSHTLTDVGDGRTLLVTRSTRLIGTLVFLRPYLKRWVRHQRPTMPERSRHRSRLASVDDGDHSCRGSAEVLRPPGDRDTSDLARFLDPDVVRFGTGGGIDGQRVCAGPKRSSITSGRFTEEASEQFQVEVERLVEAGDTVVVFRS